MSLISAPVPGLPRSPHRLIRAAVAAVGVVLLLAGCSSGPGPSQSRRENPDVKPDDIMRVINCFRAHGLPDFPDPAYDPNDGRWHYPGNQPTVPEETRRACASVMPHTTPASPIPSARLNDLLGYAKCMRAHGMPQWPDPAIDGTFRFVNPPSKGDPNLRAADAACSRYLVSSGGRISLGTADG